MCQIMVFKDITVLFWALYMYVFNFNYLLTRKKEFEKISK